MRTGVRNKAKYRNWFKPLERSLVVIAEVRETRSCVSQAAKGCLKPTKFSAGRQAPDGCERETDEGCGNELMQAGVSRTHQLACVAL